MTPTPPQSLATARQSDDPRKPIFDYLELRKPRISEVLGDKMKPEHMIQLALLATSRQPKLTQCTPQSVYLALMGAAHLQLDISGVSGEAYLVPYKDNCTLIIGYKGLVTLCHRAGVRNVSATPVYSGEPFDMTGGSKPSLVHKPDPDAPPNYDSLRGCYATWTEDGKFIRWHWMNKGDISKRRQVSQARDGDAWRVWPIEMALKTCLRRASKMMPRSATWQQELNKLAEQPDSQQALTELMGSEAEVVAESPAKEVEKDVDTGNSGSGSPAAG